jgi:hypothetical protein
MYGGIALLRRCTDKPRPFGRSRCYLYLNRPENGKGSHWRSSKRTLVPIPNWLAKHRFRGVIEVERIAPPDADVFILAPGMLILLTNLRLSWFAVQPMKGGRMSEVWCRLRNLTDWLKQNPDSHWPVFCTP